jgi:hypothetical protein
MAAESTEATGARRRRDDAPATAVLAPFLAVLVACALYFAAIAVGVLDVGPQPGDDPPGYGLVLALATLSMLAAGAALLLAGAARRAADWVASTPLFALTAPCACAAVVARFFSYDSYYAPTLRRFSDDGGISPAPIAILVVLGLLAAAATRRFPRVGVLLTGFVLVACAVAILFVGAGH